MKRLLCILSNMNTGGAETFLMKIYRSLDRSKYQMDFCINVKEKCFYEDEIVSLGGQIFRIPSKSENISKFKSQLYDLIKSKKYRYVLKISANAMGFLEMKIAKKAGAEVCAVRSSNSSNGKDFKAMLAHKTGKVLYRKYVNVKIAPSDLAAKYTFGRKAYECGNVNILHNAVDLDVYKYSKKSREKIRSQYNINDSTTIIGHVGRFMKQKNHKFLINSFYEINKQNSDTVLMLVGKGELEAEIKEQIRALGLEDKVIFTGIRSDIPDILSAMDVFVMPSFFEGMPNTVIEAQATGLPCVISDTITREANITGLVNYLPLIDPEIWATTALDAVKKERLNTKDMFISQKYDIKSVSDEFVQLIFNK